MIRALRHGLGGLALAISLYLVAAAIGGIWAAPAGRDDGPARHGIRLVNGPIHYDILIPIDVARRTFGWLGPEGIALDHPGAQWLLVGWGARDFYTTTGTYRDVSPRALWRGVTGDAAVMRVAIAGAVDDHWPALHLTDAQHDRLLAAVAESFADGADTAALDHPGFSEWDRFFPARGRFHLFNTCNVWIGDTLRAAGLRFGRWTPTPYAVTLSLALYHR